MNGRQRLTPMLVTHEAVQTMSVDDEIVTIRLLGHSADVSGVELHIEPALSSVLPRHLQGGLRHVDSAYGPSSGCQKAADRTAPATDFQGGKSMRYPGHRGERFLQEWPHDESVEAGLWIGLFVPRSLPG